MTRRRPVMIRRDLAIMITLAVVALVVIICGVCFIRASRGG